MKTVDFKNICLFTLITFIYANNQNQVIVHSQETSLKTKVEKPKPEPLEKVVTATMYNPVVNQCDKDPLITAGMFKINPRKASEHKWIAMSRDLLKRWKGEFNYGDVVKIKGAGKKDGIYTVVDTMNKRYKNRIDILETKGTPGYKFDKVKVIKLT
jgi:hypothetical protein